MVCNGCLHGDQMNHKRFVEAFVGQINLIVDERTKMYQKGYRAGKAHKRRAVIDEMYARGYAHGRESVKPMLTPFSAFRAGIDLLTAALVATNHTSDAGVDYPGRGNSTDDVVNGWRK